ncbi:unnamed protein product [Amoebophrya sp. A120]|nr:unnamed protein product [Amoebophrya sp. A120]|eukprot:GSA120T00019187001.1
MGAQASSVRAMGRQTGSLLPEGICIPGRDTAIPQAPPKTAKHFIKGTPLYGPFESKYEQALIGMGCFWCVENLFMKRDGVFSTQVGYACGTTRNPTYEEVCSGMTNHSEVCRIVYDPNVLTFQDILKTFWTKHDPTTLNQQGGDRGTQYRYNWTSFVMLMRGKQEVQVPESLPTSNELFYVTRIMRQCFSSIVKTQKDFCAFLMVLEVEIESKKKNDVENNQFTPRRTLRSGIYYYNEQQKKIAEETKDKMQKAIDEAYGAGAKKISTEILPAPTDFWMAEDYHQQYDAKPGSREYCGLRPLFKVSNAAL